MRNDLQSWELLARFGDQIRIELIVHDAGAVRRNDLLVDPQFLHFYANIIRHQTIWNEQYLLLRHRCHDLVHIARSHAHIAFGFHFSRTINVANHSRIWIRRLQFP